MACAGALLVRALPVNLAILSYHLTAINSNWYKVISGVLFYGECLFMEIILSTLDRKLVYAHRYIY